MAISPNDRSVLFKNETVMHRGKAITDIASSSEYRDFIANLPSMDVKIAAIPNDMEGRPDLLSYAAYGTVDYWWLIVEANDAYDYEVDLSAGTVIKLPII